ncbi:hypothetical protein GGF50DRAFT_121910 [Schizophyllum commune]
MPGTRGTRRVARWGGNATASAFSSSRARARAGSAPSGPARSVPPLARRVAPRHAHRTARPDLSSPPTVTAPSPTPSLRAQPTARDMQTCDVAKPRHAMLNARPVSRTHTATCTERAGAGW